MSLCLSSFQVQEHPSDVVRRHRQRTRTSLQAQQRPLSWAGVSNKVSAWTVYCPNKLLQVLKKVAVTHNMSWLRMSMFNSSCDPLQSPIFIPFLRRRQLSLISEFLPQTEASAVLCHDFPGSLVFPVSSTSPSTSQRTLDQRAPGSTTSAWGENSRRSVCLFLLFSDHLTYLNNKAESSPLLHTSAVSLSPSVWFLGLQTRSDDL